MPDRAGRSRVSHIGLIKKVQPVCSVVVSGEGHQRSRGIDSAGHIVLVAAAIASNLSAVANIPAAGLAFDGGRSQMNIRPHMAIEGISVICPHRHVHRPSLKGRNPAVGSPAVVEIFIPQCDLCMSVRHYCQRRGDAITLQAHMIAEAPRVLQHAVQAKRRFCSEGLIEVHCDPLISIRSALQRNFP